MKAHSYASWFRDCLAFPDEAVEAEPPSVALYRFSVETFVGIHVIAYTVQHERGVVYAVAIAPYDGSYESVSLFE